MDDMPTPIEPDAESFDGPRVRGGSPTPAAAIVTATATRSPGSGTPVFRPRVRRPEELEAEEGFLWGLHEAQATAPVHERALEEIRGELLERRGINVACARVLGPV